MQNPNFFRVALWAPFVLVLSCSSVAPKPDISPMRLLIGDGGVRIEQSYNHFNEQERATAAFLGGQDKFEPSQSTLPGKAWVEESSEFELAPILNSKVECHIDIFRKKLARTPASKGEIYTYQVKVKVYDGINGGPFESIINGENEGSILFGEYPLNDWQSTEDLVLNETVIPSWFYETKRKHYEITKQMGEDRFLKKTLKFDPYLKKVSNVKYEILTGSQAEVDAQMPVLAKIECAY